MPWSRFDDSFYDHPKLDRLGPTRLPAIGLYILAITWSNRFLTDGFISADRVVRLGGTVALAERLVAAGLFEKAGDDYRVHDFEQYNPMAEHVRARRELMRELGKRGGEASAQARRSTETLQRDAQAIATARPVPSRPVDESRDSGWGNTLARTRATPDQETIECDDYQAHRSQHVYIAGVGWKCLTCEKKRAAEGPGLKDKLDWTPPPRQQR